MGKQKKREDPPGPAGAPEWVVTFTDMISLLVTFFVLLMTFSSLDAYEAFKVDSFLSGKSGVHETKGDAMLRREFDDVLSASSLRRGGDVPHSRPPEMLPESIEEMGRKRSREYQELDLRDVNDGLVIEFGEMESFDPGSVRVNAELRSTLVEVARVLENYPHLVVVEGFTDGDFQPTPAYRTERAMSLGRAKAAAEVMLAGSKMNRDLVQISGLGSTLARADNESPGGRKLNRRVRLRILSLSKARANHLEAQGEQ